MLQPERSAFLFLLATIFGSIFSYVKACWHLAAIVLVGGLLVSRWFGNGNSVIVPDMNGKTAIVTGANTGIGFATATELAKNGCKVILACRSTARGEAAVERIVKATNSSCVSFMKLDLSDLDSVAAFVKQFNDLNEPCHLLINNAGVMMCPYMTTKQGIEMQFGVNHVGHFALTVGLLTNLRENKARIVNVSSMAVRFAPKDLLVKDMDSKKATYNSVKAYGISKVANVWFTTELNRRFPDIKAFALHPGVVQSDLVRHFSTPVQIIFDPIAKIVAKTSTQGAMTSLYCATAEPAPTTDAGAFFSDCTFWKSSRLARGHGDHAAKPKELWEYSEGVCAQNSYTYDDQKE